MPRYIQTDKEVDPSVLTTEMKAVLGSLEGITPLSGQIEVRKLTGEFTDSEMTILENVVNLHDGAKAKLDRQNRETVRKNELAKNPTNLSILERIDRLEKILEFY